MKTALGALAVVAACCAVNLGILAAAVSLVSLSAGLAVAALAATGALLVVRRRRSGKATGADRC